MKLDCSHCQKSLNLPDNKLPVGKPFSFTCPYCRQKNSGFIPVDGGPPPAAVPAPTPMPPTPMPAPMPMPMEGADMTALPASEPPRPDLTYPPKNQPLRSAGDNYPEPEDNFQSLTLDSTDDRLKGLVVYDEEEVAETLASKLDAMGFEPTVAVNLRDAAKQLKFASFDIVLIQEDYYGATLSSNHLLRSIQNLDNQSRRGMRVVLISPTMTTLDDLLAFSLSFDAVVNKADLDTIDRILMSIIARAKKFYAVYHDILIEHGFD